MTDIDIEDNQLRAAPLHIGSPEGGLDVLDISNPIMPVMLADLTDPGPVPFHASADGACGDAEIGDELRP